jgi:hypothetical protein
MSYQIKGAQPVRARSRGNAASGPVVSIAREVGRLAQGRVEEPGIVEGEGASLAAETQADAIGAAVARDAGTSTGSPTGMSFDFSRVRIHADAYSDQIARAMGARALTTGDDIYFSSGQLDTTSHEGRALLAHELAHVAQQQHHLSTGAEVVQKKSWTESASAWYEEKKWAVYRKMIAGMRQAKDGRVRFLRAKAAGLPAWAHESANSLITALDVIVDLFHALCLAIVGLAVGFVEGIVGLVVGLIKLVYGLAKLIADAVMAPLDKGEAVKDDFEFLANAITNFIPAIRKLIGDWWERYKNATPEEQVLMGSELVGQIEAFLATFLVAGTKAGQAGSLAVPTGLKVETKVAVIGVTETGEALGIKVPSAVAVTTTAVPAKPIAQGATMALQATALGGSGGGGGGGSSGAGSKSTRQGPLKKSSTGREPGRQAEVKYVDQLKNRYPKLKEVNIRPKARPKSSRFEGAPESSFEERMQTTQGNYSLVVYDAEGKALIEFDGISVDGWIEEIKIGQEAGKASDIVTQLRRLADFADAYGLNGVRYSIQPPQVADEVESLVVAERLRNVYRVE